MGTGGKGRPAPTHRRRGGRARAAPAPSSPLSAVGLEDVTWPRQGPEFRRCVGEWGGDKRNRVAPRRPTPFRPRSAAISFSAERGAGAAEHGAAGWCVAGAGRGGGEALRGGEWAGAGLRAAAGGWGAERGAGEPVRGFPGPPAYSWPAARGATLPAWAKGVLSAPHPRKWVLPATPGAARIWRPPPTRNTSAARRSKVSGPGAHLGVERAGGGRPRPPPAPPRSAAGFHTGPLLSGGRAVTGHPSSPGLPTTPARPHASALRGGHWRITCPGTSRARRGARTRRPAGRSGSGLPR